MRDSTKALEDTISLADMKDDPTRIVSYLDKTHRPVVLTSKGKGVAIIQSLQAYEAENEERAFLRAVVEGLLDLEEGREMSLAEVKKHFGMS